MKLDTEKFVNLVISKIFVICEGTKNAENKGKNSKVFFSRLRLNFYSSLILFLNQRFLPNIFSSE